MKTTAAKATFREILAMRGLIRRLRRFSMKTTAAKATFREILAMRGLIRRLRRLGAYRASCK